MKRALFLDRDGVLNVRIVDSYVTRPEEFVIIDGVLEALAALAPRFDYIFIVTNQQGIGKGLMTEDDLALIHKAFLEKVTAAGGRIDRVYHCPALKAEHSFQRKPAIGMALRARHDFPDLQLRSSVMVGDSRSDMLFGRRAGMQTVRIIFSAISLGGSASTPSVILPIAATASPLQCEMFMCSDSCTRSGFSCPFRTIFACFTPKSASSAAPSRSFAQLCARCVRSFLSAVGISAA